MEDRRQVVRLLKIQLYTELSYQKYLEQSYEDALLLKVLTEDQHVRDYIDGEWMDE